VAGRGAARGPGRFEAFAGAFDDELADELGEGGEDVEDEAAAGGGGVECFVQGPEADAGAAELGDEG